MTPGYKQTEVGVIPDDWGASPLGSLCEHVTVGFVGSMSHLFRSSGIPLLRGQDISPNRIDVARTRFIDQETHASWAKSSLQAGDVVVVRVGYPGTAAVVPTTICPANAASLLIARPRQDRLSSRFLVHYLNSPEGARRLLSALVGGAQQVVNTSTLARLTIPLPPRPEQHAIASVFSDADALVESLEALIAKKRQLKHGAKQELLTGRRRLPGFTRPWTETRFGDLGFTYGGLSGKTKADFGRGDSVFVPFMNVMSGVEIDPSWLERVLVGVDEKQNEVARNDLLFNGSSETPDELGLCSAVLHDSLVPRYLNSFCIGFRLTELGRALPRFVARYFRGGPGRRRMRVLAQGATRYNLSKTALCDVRIDLPCLSEQQAIDAVLSDMDAEIEALEAKLEKADRIRQGMMQELLTGRTRLLR